MMFKMMFKNKKGIANYFILALLVVGIFSSCMTPKKSLKKGHQLFAMGEYYKAVPRFKKARQLKSKEDRAETNFFLGECYNHLLNFKRAEAAYYISSRYVYQDSTVYLRLAQMEQINAKYGDAIKNYNKYLELVPDDKVANDGLKSCMIMDQLTTPSDYVVQPFHLVNSHKSDYCPVFMGTKYNTLYFTSTRDVDKKGKVSGITGGKTADIFYSRLNAQGMWIKPLPVAGTINSPADEGVVSFDATGTRMYFTRSFHEGVDSIRTMIMESQRTGAKWANPKQIKLAPDSVLVAHPAISPDGQTLYFVSNMRGGQGGLDIWCVHKDGSKWGIPQNMGPEINSADDEMFPFVRNNHELYFSSRGHLGLGGLDIFRAVLNQYGEWEVMHLPVPINSSDDDFGICFEGDKDSGFLSSNRNNARGYDKIYHFGIPTYDIKVVGTIVDSKTNEPMGQAHIQFVGNDGQNDRPEVRKNGVFHHELKPDYKYQFLASAGGYLSQRVTFNTFDMKQDYEYQLKVQMVSISHPVTLNNVFYDFGAWDLKPEAKLSLDSLAITLKDNPNITIEISSHTDAIGTDSANLVLSQKRAQGVVDYLVEVGVDSARLTAVGYGESQPVEVGPDLLSKYSFLRPGDVLNDDLLRILTKKQRAIANQINRRTEFMVLRTNYKDKSLQKK